LPKSSSNQRAEEGASLLRSAAKEVRFFPIGSILSFT